MSACFRCDKAPMTHGLLCGACHAIERDERYARLAALRLGQQSLLAEASA